MKKALVLFLLFAVVFLPQLTAGGGRQQASATKTIGYYMDAADDYYKAAFDVFKVLADREGWRIYEVVGQGTAPEQISNVENFITNRVDAIVVVQNSPQASAECIRKANAANIPIFFLWHEPPNNPPPAGFVGFDWVNIGELAGRSAMQHNVRRLIMIEGKLGQGAAGGQSEGFIKAYSDAGRDVGDAASFGRGGRDLQVVFWGSGGWFADPAKKAMQDAITTLGANGFDGAYVHNDEMLDGVIQAIQEAGLTPGNYWLGSSNGKEKSWRWVADGIVTMDVNQPPGTSVELCFQQVKAYFEGRPYKKFVYTPIIPFERTNINMGTLVPFDRDEYFRRRDAGIIKADLNDPSILQHPGYR